MLKKSNFRALVAGRRPGRAWAQTLGGALVASLLSPAAWAQNVTYAVPIVITKGGTYTGNYRSSSSSVACVRIATSEAVVLESCQLAGAGNLIEAGENTNLTVRNCQGQGLTPSVDNQAPGRFLDVYRPQRLVVEHNVLTQTSGMVVNRWAGTGQAGQTLTVRYNQARNIDGRWRNGGSTRSSFLILNTVQHVAGAEIAYNEVLNTADQSLVEDNLNFYNSSGTAGSPVRVHDNFVRGAYPFPATAAQFTGTGMTTDGDAKTAEEATSYIEADHNQFVSTGNAAMNLAAGHDIFYHDNRLVTSGLLPGGARLNATYAATAVFNYYQQPGNVFFNNRVENNTIGYVRWGGNDPYPDRQDQSPGACAPCTGTIHLPNPVTLATEDQEWQLWQAKLQQNGLAVGPAGASAPAPAPVPTAPVPTPPASANGQVVNPGFEADGAAVGAPTGWQTTTGANTNDNADYTEAYGGTHSGSYHGTHYRPEAYEIYTYQTIGNLPAGTYSFRAWVRSGGGQPQAQLQAKNYGGAPLSATILATGGNWTLVELKNIVVSNGQCEIGFYSKANAGQWIYFDDVAFDAQAAAPVAAPVVLPTTTTAVNTVLNASFEDDQAPVPAPRQWLTQTGSGTNDNADYTEAYTGGHSGSYHGTHYRPEAYEVYTYQTVGSLPAGTYTLRAWVKSSGGQPQVQLQAKNYGGSALTAAIPATPNGQWVQVSVPNVAVSNGQCEVGFYSKANPGQWLYFDDVELLRQDSAAATAPAVPAPAATVGPALYPNPATDQVTVAINYTQASNIVLSITNMQGVLAAEHWRPVVAGDNQIVIPTAYIPSGLYILQIQNKDQPLVTLRLDIKH